MKRCLFLSYKVSTNVEDTHKLVQFFDCLLLLRHVLVLLISFEYEAKQNAMNDQNGRDGCAHIGVDIEITLGQSFDQKEGRQRKDDHGQTVHLSVRKDGNALGIGKNQSNQSNSPSKCEMVMKLAFDRSRLTVDSFWFGWVVLGLPRPSC